MITVTWSETSTTTAAAGGDTVTSLPGVLELDILEQETFEGTATVTEHAVEEGAAITDHQVPNLDRVRFDVVVSDSPISVRQGLLGTTYGSLPGGATVLVGPNLLKSSVVFDTLQRLLREGIEVDIIGLQQDIQGWLITSVTTDRRVDTSGALVASIVAQEVVEAKLVEVAAPSPRVERVRPSSNTGQQATQVAGDSVVSSDPDDRAGALQSCRDDFYETQLQDLGV
jgi:hypothetical protein